VSYICELSEFKHFILNAKPNEKFLYYSGLTLTDSIMAKELKKLTYNHASKGDIYLVQKRFQDVFDFIAIKASRPPVYRLVPLSDEKLKEATKLPRQYAPRKVKLYGHYNTN
jgi:hypothetical protein